MFYKCCNLTELELSHFNTKNSCSFVSMFEGCSKLEYIDISNFDSSSCENLTGMFCDCENITEVNMLKWDMSKIKRFHESYNGLDRLFQGCKKLGYIKMNCNFNNINYILKNNIKNEYKNGKNIKTYHSVTLFFGLPEYGTFIYPKKNKCDILINKLPKSWNIIEE